MKEQDGPVHLAIIIIGNEILSYAVRETNLEYVLRQASEAGYSVDEVRFVSDRVEAIAQAVHDLGIPGRLLITSGGIGPTHDDVTVEAIAEAYRVPLEENTDMLGFLEQCYGRPCAPSVRTMAQLPEGTEVLFDGAHWPILRFCNCYILPGLPQAFYSRIDRIFAALPKQSKWITAELVTDQDESVFARQLAELQHSYPEVEIGSYPQSRRMAGYAVKLTVKARSKRAVEQVYTALQGLFRQNGW